MRDPWSADPSWWKISGSRGGLPRHGEWGGRLPRGAIACMEMHGYSMWHLLAAKALPMCDIETFLESACEVDTNDLLDDLRETMTVFDDTWKDSWIHNSGLWENHRSWRKMCNRTKFCTPLEICERLRVPLISWPDYEDECDLHGYVLHPVIEAAQMESLRRLE